MEKMPTTFEEEIFHIEKMDDCTTVPENVLRRKKIAPKINEMRKTYRKPCFLVILIELGESTDPQGSERSMKVPLWVFEEDEKNAEFSAWNFRISFNPEHIVDEILYFWLTFTGQEADFYKNKGNGRRRVFGDVLHHQLHCKTIKCSITATTSMF